MSDNKVLITVLRWTVIIAMPFLLGLGMIRLVIAWDYPSFSYARIPPDLYGFTTEQRLELAHGTLDYMRRLEPAEQVIYLLEDLRLPGTDQPLYNEREIGHMIDVKNVSDGMSVIVIVSAVIVVVGLTYLIANPNTRALGWRTMMQAGLFTIVALALIALFLILAWPVFFELFHELLFPPGTWTFYYTDSLIRLFPEQFWFEVGVIIVFGTLLMAGALTLFGYWMWKRTAAAEAARSTSAAPAVQ